MTWLPDVAVVRLRAALEAPDLEGTRYRLIESLGAGGMGTVWLVEDLRLGRKVALKVLRVPDGGGQLSARLLREASVLAHLEHPGIVPIHDVGTLADGRSFYVMKRVEGEPLDRLAPKLAMAERLRVYRRVLDAAGFAHTRGVLHRDLKPQNIMVGPFGEVLVLDWGLAKLLVEEAPAVEAHVSAKAGHVIDTGHGSVLGTPGWMAPEQERGDNTRVDVRSDVFALGALLRFLLAAGGEHVPRPLAAVAAKAMSARPEERYAGAEAIAAELDRWLDGLPVGAYRESALERTRRFAARHRVAIALVLTYLVVRALLLVQAR